MKRISVILLLMSFFLNSGAQEINDYDLIGVN